MDPLCIVNAWDREGEFVRVMYLVRKVKKKTQNKINVHFCIL